MADIRINHYPHIRGVSRAESFIAFQVHRDYLREFRGGDRRKHV